MNGDPTDIEIAIGMIAATLLIALLCRKYIRRALTFEDSGLRPKQGACPGCGASEVQWCFDGCTMLDPMDYR